MPEISLLTRADEALLRKVSDGVFDGAPRPDRVREFLDDSRHHIVVARHDDEVIGFASGVHYVHPDKDPEMWINEVGVASEHRGRGVGTSLVRALLARAAELGCRSAWVLTERDNAAALALYASAGGVEPGGETVLLEFDVTRASGER